MLLTQEIDNQTSVAKPVERSVEECTTVGVIENVAVRGGKAAGVGVGVAKVEDNWPTTKNTERDRIDLNLHGGGAVLVRFWCGGGAVLVRRWRGALCGDAGAAVASALCGWCGGAGAVDGGVCGSAAVGE
nr:hypothetical protein Itr_chr05CG17130 [Ipomoea trifida]